LKKRQAAQQGREKKIYTGVMAKGKVKSFAVKLISSAGTGYFYLTTRNPKSVPGKLILKKVCIA
jgi:ribosomal protein L33